MPLSPDRQEQSSEKPEPSACQNKNSRDTRVPDRSALPIHAALNLSANQQSPASTAIVTETSRRTSGVE
jgi:hypothetical protein